MAGGFGDRLKAAMLAAGVDDPARVADAAGISVRTVKRYMALPQADLSARTAYKIARRLDVRLSWLAEGELPVKFSPEILEASEIIGQLSDADVRTFLAFGHDLLRKIM